MDVAQILIGRPQSGDDVFRAITVGHELEKVFAVVEGEDVERTVDLQQINARLGWIGKRHRPTLDRRLVQDGGVEPALENSGLIAQRQCDRGRTKTAVQGNPQTRGDGLDHHVVVQ